MGALSPGATHLLPSTIPVSVGCVRLLPSASPASVPTRAGRVPTPCVSPRPSRRVLTIQNLRRSLVRNWRPCLQCCRGCGPGAEPAPSYGAGPVEACELFSGLDRSLCSANGRKCVRAVNFLSLFCCPTV